MIKKGALAIVLLIGLLTVGDSQDLADMAVEQIQLTSLDEDTFIGFIPTLTSAVPTLTKTNTFLLTLDKNCLSTTKDLPLFASIASIANVIDKKRNEKVAVGILKDSLNKVVAKIPASAFTAVDGEVRIKETVLPPESVSEEVLDDLKEKEKNPCVEYASFDRVFTNVLQVAPNDKEFQRLWALQNIHAPEGWDITTGKSQPLVAVIDTGVDIRHPDLEKNIQQNSGEIFGNGLDDDNNGCPDDRYGCNWVNPFTPNGDVGEEHPQQHGSHVAGVIGAVGNNGIGVVGVNWQAKILPVKIVGREGKATLSAILKALTYARQMGAKIANISITANVRNINNFFDWHEMAQIRDTFARAEKEGMLIITAAGNNGVNIDENHNFPASFTDFDNIITVTAVDQMGELAVFNSSESSSYGSLTVHVAAPGKDIESTFPGGVYGIKQGTSMAAPYVAGIASVLWGYSPLANYKLVKEVIMKSITPLPSLLGKTLAPGVPNLRKALAFINQPPTANAGPDLTANAGDLLTFDAVGSSDLEGELVSFVWDFSDGFRKIGEKAVYRFGQAGQFTAKLTVKDKLGVEDVDVAVVTIKNIGGTGSRKSAFQPQQAPEEIVTTEKEPPPPLLVFVLIAVIVISLLFVLIYYLIAQ